MTTFFYAIAHHDPGSAYGVSVPDLPGCYSAADDETSLMINVAEAIALWAEDQPLPTPSSLEKIRRAHAGDLAEGAFIMAVPVLVDA